MCKTGKFRLGKYSDTLNRSTEEFIQRDNNLNFT